MRIAILCITAVCLGSGCQQPTSVPNDLNGAWQIRTRKVETATDTTVDQYRQPSLLIFADRYYSLVRTLGDTSMRAFAERWSPTDEEKVARFDEMLVNAGQYDIEGETITARPIISRFPEFMGGVITYRYTIEGDTLTLTALDEYSFDGAQAPWAAAGIHTTLKFTRAGSIPRAGGVGAKSPGTSGRGPRPLTGESSAS